MLGHPRKRLALALVGVTALAIALPALAEGAPPPVTAAPFDAQLSFDAHFAEGEPSIAVNPANPKNIIVTFLSNTGLGTYGLQNSTTPVARDYTSTIQACDYVVTQDGGAHWQRHELPLTGLLVDPTRTNCSDTLVVFDKAGVAYVIGGTYEFPTFAAGQGDFRMIRSTNGGRSWSKPTVVSPTFLSPGAAVTKWKGLRFYDDREFIAIDDSRHVIYVNGTQGRADAEGSVGDREYLTSSSDGGRTWRNALAVGVASASPLSAAQGLVGFTSPPPVGAKRACNCFDFIVSADRAKTVVRRPSPVPGGSTPTGLLTRAYTAADPRQRGHFAVMAVVGAEMLVYRTTDAGRTWSAPSHLSLSGRGVDKPWMAYSPTGVLGIGWRGSKDDGSYGFYGAVSRDDGATWSVRRISRRDSPANDHLYVAGDDTSAVVLTTDTFLATWGDWRGHELHTWWGGFPLG